MGFFNRLRGKKKKPKPKKDYDNSETRNEYDNEDNFWLDPENFKEHFAWGIINLDDEERLVDILLEHEDLHHRTLAFYQIRNKYKNEIPDMMKFIIQLSEHINMPIEDFEDIISDYNAYLWAKKVFLGMVDSKFYKKDVFVEGMKLMN